VNKPNKTTATKLMEQRRIPPRALRSDTPVGTAWVPRWKWAGKLFGREVPLPPIPGKSWSLGSPEGAEPPQAESVVPVSQVPAQGMALGTDTIPATDREAQGPRKSPDAPPSLTQQETRAEPWGAWAYPLLAILVALVMTFALGTTFGAVLATGNPPAWLSGGVLGAFLLAPSGALLLLLSSLACFVQSRDDQETRPIWRVAGILLLTLFLLATFGYLL
jgi:hypothetical protein